MPTGRAAYSDTRQWLLQRHGPVCAYCGVTWPERTITLDHVTPRRGQTAYDRRDNLVLACKRSNGAKADKPFLAFLFAQRARAINLLRYGDHLSAGILDLCRQLAGGDAPQGIPTRTATNAPRVVYGREPDEESPYRDEAPSAAPPAAQPPASPARKSAPRTVKPKTTAAAKPGAGKHAKSAKPAAPPRKRRRRT